MSEQSGGAAGQAATRETEKGLLQQAVLVLRMRYERGNSYTDLSPTAAAELENALNGVAMAEDDLDDVDRGEAIALAHRLIDDDHPELSPIWPGQSR